MKVILTIALPVYGTMALLTHVIHVQCWPWVLQHLLMHPCLILHLGCSGCRNTEEVLTMAYTHITVERSFQDKIATITMQRLEVLIAFNGQLFHELQISFTVMAPYDI